MLRAHCARQAAWKLAAGPAWVDTGRVFTHRNGTGLHPHAVTAHFRELTAQAELPPIRLHDLRHGAATLALAAGADLKTVSEMLGHSTIVITADAYTSVLPEHARAAAESTAALLAGARNPDSSRSARPLHTQEINKGVREASRMASVQVRAVGRLGIEPRTRGLKAVDEDFWAPGDVCW